MKYITSLATWLRHNKKKEKSLEILFFDSATLLREKANRRELIAEGKKKKKRKGKKQIKKKKKIKEKKKNKKKKKGKESDEK